jgi:hypothetical protein
MRRLTMLVLAATASISTALAAGELKIDGSTPDTTSAGLHAMYGAHSNREICQLQTAILNITLGEKSKREAAGAAKDAPAPDLGTFIDGMTYDQIIDKAKDYPSKVMGLCRN